MKKFREFLWEKSICCIVNDFEERGSVADRTKLVPQHTARSPHDITTVEGKYSE